MLTEIDGEQDGGGDSELSVVRIRARELRDRQHPLDDSVYFDAVDRFMDSIVCVDIGVLYMIC